MSILAPKIQERVLLGPQKEQEFDVDDDYGIELETGNKVHLCTLFVSGDGLFLRNRKTNKNCRIYSQKWVGIHAMPSGFFRKEDERFIEPLGHLKIDVLQAPQNGRAKVKITAGDSPYFAQVVISGEDDREERLKEKYNILGEGLEGKIWSPGKNCYAETSAGKDEDDEDAVLVDDDLLVLGDGMGGRGFGDVASAKAVAIVRQLLLQDPNKPVTNALFQEVCQKLCDANLPPQLPSKSSTTLVVARKRKLSKDKNKFEIGHVGDSKAYAISLFHRKIIEMTKDQSVVQGLIDLGILSPLQRYESKEMNKVTNIVRGEGLKQPAQVLPSIEGKPGDIIVIVVGDGVSDFVTPDEILDIVLRQKKVSRVVAQTKQKVRKVISAMPTRRVQRFHPNDLPPIITAICKKASSRQNRQKSGIIKLGGKYEIVTYQGVDHLSAGAII